MKDIGKKLYEMYQKHMEQQGIGTDSWDQIDASDQQAWRWLGEDMIEHGYIP